MNALHVVLFSVAALLGLGVLVHSKPSYGYMEASQPMQATYVQQQPMMAQQYAYVPAGYGSYGGSGGVGLSIGGGMSSWWIWFLCMYSFSLPIHFYIRLIY